VIRVAIIGAAGRMGRAMLQVASEFPELTIVAALVSPASALLGQDAGELATGRASDVPLSSDLPAALVRADVAIDFSNAQATRTHLSACRSAHRPLLIGTTGFGADLTPALEEASREIPLLVAPNTSLGVSLLVELVRTAARALPAGFDIEILEAHHRTKRDAPSGTALALGRAAAEGREQPFEKLAAPGRASGTARAEGEIGFAVVRGGDIVGEHTVLFAGPGERLSLGHQATDRAIFARGALQAASWLASRPPGRYFMRDLVSYKSGS
jgi:4-hydroxy-tetrahydrodipicolinate reductase